MPWPPRIGDPLPRAEDAWCTREKLVDWVLGKGHGEEWGRVFKVGCEEAPLVWSAIKRRVVGATVDNVRKKPKLGVSCRVRVELVVGSRVALVALVWHYPFEGAAPRLITAYPTD